MNIVRSVALIWARLRQETWRAAQEACVGSARLGSTKGRLGTRTVLVRILTAGFFPAIVSMSCAIPPLALAQGEGPWQDFEVAGRLYEIDDLAFPVTALPVMRLECRSRSGRYFNEHGEQVDESSPLEIITIRSGAPYPSLYDSENVWKTVDSEPLNGRFTAEIGPVGNGLETSVFIKDGLMRFGNPAEALFEGLRLNPNQLRITVKDPSTGAKVKEHRFRTEGFDACRFAYACGDQAFIRAACGARMRPSAPQLNMLKQEIEAVLDRYPANP